MLKYDYLDGCVQPTYGAEETKVSLHGPQVCCKLIYKFIVYQRLTTII